MRLVVTGVGADGRSMVVSDDEPTRSASGDGAESARLWVTRSLPPTVEVPASAIEPRKIGVPTGGSAWFHSHFPPGLEIGLHRSDTLDHDLVVEGQLTLVLEDGEVTLEAGDGAVLPGVVHGWRAGPEGATLAVVAISTLTRPGAS